MCAANMRYSHEVFGSYSECLTVQTRVTSLTGGGHFLCSQYARGSHDVLGRYSTNPKVQTQVTDLTGGGHFVCSQYVRTVVTCLEAIQLFAKN